jgi:hypothetical protein
MDALPAKSVPLGRLVLGLFKGLVAEPNLVRQILQDLKVKLLNPDRRRCAVAHAEALGGNERHVCR